MYTSTLMEPPDDSHQPEPLEPRSGRHERGDRPNLRRYQLLERQGANPYRIRAYRQGAETVACQTPLQAILAERGIGGLMALRGIGDSLAAQSKKSSTPNGCHYWNASAAAGRPSDSSVRSPTSSQTGHTPSEQLGIRTLTQLEAAAWDGRLAHQFPAWAKSVSVP